MKNKTSRQEWRIKCPFFRCHNATDIGCDGITDDSVIELRFRDKRGKQRQQQIFCANDYHKCELFRAIREHLEDE